MSEPRITVFTPSYNRAGCMGHALASVLSGDEGECAAVDARLCECVRGYTIEAMVEDYVQAFRVALGGSK